MVWIDPGYLSQKRLRCYFIRSGSNDRRGAEQLNSAGRLQLGQFGQERNGVSILIVLLRERSDRAESDNTEPFHK